MESLETRCRRLAQKWISQGRHPMRANKPEERALLERCATQLMEEVRASRCTCDAATAGTSAGELRLVTDEESPA